MELFYIIIIGIISCFAMDFWHRTFKTFFKITLSDWAVVGRWFILSISKGKVYNSKIDNEPFLKNELPIGWFIIQWL